MLFGRVGGAILHCVEKRQLDLQSGGKGYEPLPLGKLDFLQIFPGGILVRGGAIALRAVDLLGGSVDFRLDFLARNGALLQKVIMKDPVGIRQ